MLTAVALGLAQGVRHSIEPDHVAAVSVLIREEAKVWRSTWLGAIWGFGHSLSLLAMSVALVAFGAALPDSLDRAFALIVALVLIALGVRSLWWTHAGADRKVRPPRRAVVVGAVHGLAGTSALTATVFAALPSTSARLTYISLFGIGSIVGMASMSGLAGLWLGRVVRPWLMTTLRFAIGGLSIAIGVLTGLDALAPS